MPIPRGREDIYFTLVTANERTKSMDPLVDISLTRNTVRDTGFNNKPDKD
jgi:hypothetical protein